MYINDNKNYCFMVFSMNQEDMMLYKKIFYHSLFVVALMSGLFVFITKYQFSVSIFIGGIIAMFNFFALFFLVKKITNGEPKTQIIYSLLFMFKLGIIGVIIFFIINYSLSVKDFEFSVDILGLLLGITVIITTLIVEFFIDSSKTKR